VELEPIPGIPELGGIGTNSRDSGIGWNWNQFPEFRNWVELEPIPGIPELGGIRTNSRNSVPELLTYPRD
jgi:hypothetical protein